MTSELVAVSFDTNDPHGLARFWAVALRWDVGDTKPAEVELSPTDGTRFGVRFRRVSEEKVGRNRIHLDLTTTSPDDQSGTVSELIGLGAEHVDVGQTGDEPHVVLADPDGTGPCITWGGAPPPGNVTCRLHLVLAPFGSGDLRAEIDRLVSLGATRVDRHDEDAGTVLMTDPEGNKFRVVTSSS